MSFTLRQLDIFSAVMATGQVRAAAERLHLSQAAVSQALRELAEALDISLFERRGRALEPTAAARRLAELSAGPRAELGRLPERLRGGPDTPLAGPIHIAASSTIARYLLPGALAALSRAQPDVRLTLSSGNTATVAARVADGQADLGFIEGPAEREDLDTIHWRTDRLEIIAAPDGPARIEPDALADHRWVLRESGSGTRRVFEQSLALAGVALPIAHVVLDDSGAQVRAVAAGAGLACVSQAAARTALESGQVRIVEVPGLVLQRPLWSIRQRNRGDDLLATRLRMLLS